MIKNPDAPLRTVYLAGMNTIIQAWSNKVPKSVTVPNQYIILQDQIKNPTDKGKEGCMEWLCTMIVDIYNINPSGYSSIGGIDNIEEQVIDWIESGFIVDGFMLKSIDFIESVPFTPIETPTQTIERRTIRYQHWLAQN